MLFKVMMSMLTAQLNGIPKENMISTQPSEANTPQYGQPQKAKIAVLPPDLNL